MTGILMASKVRRQGLNLIKDGRNSGLGPSVPLTPTATLVGLPVTTFSLRDGGS